jgi:hypothetical protein
MAIIGIDRPPDGHSSATMDIKHTRTYIRTYWVYTDTVADDEYFIRNNLPPDPMDGQLLMMASPYYKDQGALLKALSVERGPKAAWDDRPGREKFTGNRWVVRCEWGMLDPTEATESGNPYDVRPDVTMDGVALQKPFEIDSKGKPVLNAAFDYFDPPPMTDEQNHTIKIIRNEPAIPLSVIINNAATINLGQWYEFPDSSVKVEPFQTQILFSQFLNGSYFRIAYTFTYTPGEGGWKRKILNQGYRGLDANGKLVNLNDTHGMPLQSPVLLDSDGKQLAYPVNKDNIVQLEFDEFKQIDFDSTFNFPPDIFGGPPLG